MAGGYPVREPHGKVSNDNEEKGEGFHHVKGKDQQIGLGNSGAKARHAGRGQEEGITLSSGVLDQRKRQTARCVNSASRPLRRGGFFGWGP